jgi:hypothetical protein
MRSCQYEECGSDLTGYPPASKYCSIAHAALAKRAQQADYARRNKDPINRRRRNRVAKKAREESGFKVPEPPQDDDRDDSGVVDYMVADQAPRFLGIARGHPSHDQEAWRQRQQGEPDQMNWSDLVATRERFQMRSTAFPAPSMGPQGDGFTANGIGQSIPRSRGIYSRDEGPGELVNPAAAGVAVVRSPASGQRAVQAHQEKRFGDKVDPPIQVTSAHLESSMPALEGQEQVQAVREKTASDHMRSQVWNRR